MNDYTINTCYVITIYYSCHSLSFVCVCMCVSKKSSNAIFSDTRSINVDKALKKVKLAKKNNIQYFKYKSRQISHCIDSYRDRNVE